MLPPDFNLNLLRSLDALLDTRNLTLAARQLGTTQSAMSRQLAQLRRQLDDPLLVRDGQRYLPTTRAESLRGPLKAMLTQLHTVLETPRFDPVTCTRRFEMSGSDYIAEYMLPELMQAIAPQAPRLRLAYRMWEPGHYGLLADEGVDLVTTIADALPDNLHGRPLGEDKPVCAMRVGHPLAAQPLTLEQYVAWPHARVVGGSDKDSFVERYLAGQGRQREIRLAVPFFASALRIVADSELLLTIPEHIAAVLSRHAPIAWQPLPFDVHTYRYWLLWHARAHHDAAHQWFRNQVFDVLHRSIHGVSQYRQG